MTRLLSILCLVFSLSLSFVACDSDHSEDVAVADLPQSITTYVSQNYPNSTIEEAERETENNRTTYEIELSTGEELVFDDSGNYIGKDDD